MSPDFQTVGAGHNALGEPRFRAGRDSSATEKPGFGDHVLTWHVEDETVPHESALERVRSILHGVSRPSGRLTQHVHGVSKTEDYRPEEHHVSHQASHHSSHNEGHHSHALHQSTVHHPPQIHDGDGNLRHQEHFPHPSHLHQGHAHACQQGHSHVRGGYQGHAMSSNETVRPRPTRAHTVPLPGSHP
ncbi:unnamed protein product [Symbiodinium sp. CCMP2456]|nr:unnamed protein product [Symbiodinium sp. CCMP2456]